MVSRRTLQSGGFTLIELLITAGLTTVFLGVLANALVLSMSQYRSTSSALTLQRRTSSAAQTLRAELKNMGTSTLTPVPVIVPGAPIPWTDRVRFREVNGWSEGDITYGEFKSLSTRIEAGELDDGIDQDGDGLVDERELVLTLDDGGPNERSVVLERGLLEWFPGEVADGADTNGNGLEDEPGLCFVQQGRTLTIWMALGQQHPDGTVATSTRTLSILLRN